LINQKPYLICEISANHCGNLKTAKKLIKTAKKNGGDAVKLQTFTPDTMTLNSNKSFFKVKNGLWKDYSLWKLYAEAQTPLRWHKELFEYAKNIGIKIFSTPFDETAVDFLEKLNVPAYKIASFEITDIPLIEYVASKGKPVIISTGIAEISDIELAIDACKRMGNNDIAILKCTSSYPAPIEEANMVMIKDLKERFGLVTGLSDHTMGSTAPVVATCFGAKIIEKHFILNHNVGGPDASFSMDESEFTQMVQAVREAEKAIGKVDYDLTEKQTKGKDFSRSLYVVKDIKEGEVFSEENIRSIRPGFGAHPKYLKQILGTRSKKEFSFGDRLDISTLKNNN